MKKASVRDLRYNFAKVERMLRAGENIEVTKRNKVIAKIIPVQDEPIEYPDFRGRIKALFGDRKLKISTAELLEWDRDRR